MRRIYAYNDGKYRALNESRAEKPVTKENADYIARKVKEASGVKVCFDEETGSMKRCSDKKLILRSALNGKRKLEDLIEAAKKLGECTECNGTKKVKKVAECNGTKKVVKESLCSVFEKGDGDGEDDTDAPANIRESVASRFAKYRKLYEDAELTEKSDDDDADGDDDINFDGLFGDDSSDDKGGDNDGGDDNKDGKDGDDKDDKGDDNEEVPITAVVITLTDKDKLDAFKDKLVDADISEHDIEILDGDDDDKEGKIRISVDAFDALKDFLKSEYDKDLEEELGGEVVTDGDDDDKDDKGDDKGDGDSDDKGEGDGDDDGFNFDNVDLFGDDSDDDKGNDNKE